MSFQIKTILFQQISHFFSYLLFYLLCCYRISIFRVVFRICNLHTTFGQYCILRTKIVVFPFAELIVRGNICLRDRFTFALLSSVLSIQFLFFFFLQFSIVPYLYIFQHLFLSLKKSSNNQKK
jgi:hypothetical protein